MILEGSRYTNALLVRVTLPDGTYQWAALSEREAIPRAVVYRYRTVGPGDRFDTLAGREYGEPQLWWVIAKANPEVFYPEVLTPGTVIRIPDAVSIH